MMRVLYFTDNNSDHNRRFLLKLAESDHQIFYLSLAGEPHADYLPSGIRRVSTECTYPRQSHPRSLRSFVPELKRIAEDVNADVIQAGAIQSCAYLAGLAQLSPVLAMSWGSDILVDAVRDDEWRDATKIALDGADGLFCDSDSVRRRAIELKGSGFKHIVQFPWGIEPGVFSPDGSTIEVPWGSNDYVLISTRALEVSYGADVLIDAFDLAFGVEPRLRLLLLGSGSFAANIKAIAEQRQFSEKLLLAGDVKRNDLPRYFRSANAYISCTPSDGSSISLLEAMATGLPAIVADNSSNREWLSEGINGWFGTIGSAKSFSEKILEVVSISPAARERVQRLSIETTARRANWAANFPLLLKAYEALR